jgi:hypothetical protein
MAPWCLLLTREILPMRSLTLLLHAALLVLLVGCGSESEPTGDPGAPDGPPPDRAALRQAAAGDAAAALDLAALAWGGADGLRAETGFHIVGKTWLEANWALEMDVELWRRYEPPGYYKRRHLGAGEGSGRVIYEEVTVATESEGWRLDMTSRQPMSFPQLVQALRESPSPRDLILHREKGLTLAHHGTRPIPELDDMTAWALTATYPDGLVVWAYVEVETGLLRKISYKQRQTGMWQTSVFQTYRPSEQADEYSILERVQLWQEGREVQRFLWGRREASPEYPPGIFEKPVGRPAVDPQTPPR